MHRLNSLLVLALFAFSGCASTKFTAEKNSPKSVILAPDVSAEMLDSSFWIHKIKNPDEVKMTADEIYIWNNLNTNNPGLFLVDLKKYDSVISGEEIRGEIVHYTPKRKWYKKVTTKESEKIIELKESDWKSLFKKMNISPLGTFEDFTANKKASQNKKDFPVRRGICVARSNLRMIPDDDFYSDDKDFWFDDAAQNSGILMNEPVVVLWESLDKNFLLVRTAYCSGWIHREDVAFCDDEQFFECFDWTKKKAEGFITVTADRFLLPDEYVVGFNASDSLKSTLPEFFMGTRLLCASWNQDGIVENFSPRVPHGC
ncbi:MAG: SH3 domain-containing protein, partial [Treponema sp.]|nr:SH3 domain-containing protein [Candidatus Treponema equifaecale]